MPSPRLPKTMQVWTCPRYGGPETLTLEQLPIPKLAADAVLIRVHATTVSSGDARIRALRLPEGFALIAPLVLGFGGPRRAVFGSEVAGVVARVGGNVSTFSEGDPVIAFTDTQLGGHAEYVVIKESGLIVPKPANLTIAQAASLCFGGMTASDYLRRAMLQRDERLLVIGASGTVGSACVQLAVAQGAHVTALTSTPNIALVRSLGAHAVIDYTHQAFATLGERWDVIADTVGASSFSECAPALNEGGRYLAIAGALRDLFALRQGTKRSIAGPASASLKGLQALAALAERGAYSPPIDSVFPFADMPAAHARVDSHRKRGSVVVQLMLDGP